MRGETTDSDGDSSSPRSEIGKGRRRVFALGVAVAIIIAIAVAAAWTAFPRVSVSGLDTWLSQCTTVEGIEVRVALVNFTLRNDGILSGAVTYAIVSETEGDQIRQGRVVVPGSSEVKLAKNHVIACRYDEVTVRVVSVRIA